jgi:hypothetical protein
VYEDSYTRSGGLEEKRNEKESSSSSIQAVAAAVAQKKGMSTRTNIRTRVQGS